jgi:trimeric autotransporter adhesin
MRRFCSGLLTAALFSFLLGPLAGCGGGSSAPVLSTPSKIAIAPGNSSIDVGTTLTFSAAVTPTSTVPVTFSSSNPGVLSFVASAPGVACAGRWDTAGQICSPTSVGVAQVTASANGVVSAPVIVYVHQHVDTVKVSVLNPPIPMPDCVTLAPATGVQNFLDLQAQAFSNGTDVTNTVGSFTFSQSNGAVATLSTTDPELQNNNGNQIVQARITTKAPGYTQVFATVSGVNSLPAAIPDSHGVLHPYVETCIVQSISLQVGSNDPSNTTFAIANSGSTSLTATVVDRLGYQLQNAPITWTSLSPTNATVSTTGGVSAKAPGGASIVAACLPSSCNLTGGIFPVKPVFSATAPNGVLQGTPITGTVTGSQSNTTVYATTSQCNLVTGVPIPGCQPLVYPISTSNNTVGNSTTLPSSPNTFIFAPSGSKAFLGSDEGLITFTPGTASTVTQMNNVPGKILAISPDSNKLIVSDTKSIPNQVYILGNLGASGSASPTTTSLLITGATAAAFSPDAVRAYIVAGKTLYVFSDSLPLKAITLGGTANGVGSYANGALGYLSGGSASPAINLFNTCDTNYAISASIPVPRLPLMFQALSDGVHAIGVDPPGLDVFAIKALAPTPATSAQPSSDTCPFPVTAPDPPEQQFSFANLGEGNFIPLKIIIASDNSKAYILAANLSSIFIYNFGVGTVSAIPLTGGPAPLDASITSDGTLLYVGTTDTSVHVVSTVSGGDLQQVTFTNNNSTNKGSLCANIPQTCNPDLIAIKP